MRLAIIVGPATGEMGAVHATTSLP
jgi:hypothetical protein